MRSFRGFAGNSRKHFPCLLLEPHGKLNKELQEVHVPQSGMASLFILKSINVSVTEIWFPPQGPFENSWCVLSEYVLQGRRRSDSPERSKISSCTLPGLSFFSNTELYDPIKMRLPASLWVSRVLLAREKQQGSCVTSHPSHP